MGKKGKYAFWDRLSGSDDSGESVAILRSQLKHEYLNRFYNIFMNKFEWEGLDEDVKEQQANYIMRKFWADGTVSCRAIGNTGLLAFAPYAVAYYNMYDFPEQITMINERGVSSTVIPNSPLTVNKQAVIGYCQPNHKPIHQTVDLYINRIVEIDMIIHTNLQLQKIPFLIGVSDKDKAKMKDIVKRVLNDEVVVYADLEDLQKVQALMTEAPYLVDKLNDHRKALMDELLTLLGIDNMGGLVKKERLVKDEANANNEIINVYSQVIEDEINSFLERVNKTFNRNISIKAKSIPVQAISEEESGDLGINEHADETGGKDNE